MHVVQMPPPKTPHHSILGHKIAEAAGHAAAAEHELIILIGQFDEAEGWFHQGAISCAQWLSWRIGLAPGAAREKVRVAIALRELPLIDAAFARGRISYSKVRALTRVANPENEEALLMTADSCTAAQLERLCRKFRTVIEDRDKTEVEHRRYVHSRHTDDGMVRVTIQLLPDEAARFLAAVDDAGKVEVKVEVKVDGKVNTHLNRADGAMRLAENYLADNTRIQRKDAGCEVILHVDEADFAGADGNSCCGYIENANEAGVSAETARRVSCDAAIVRVTEDAEGKVLDVRRRRRTVPAAMRRALQVRAKARCQFPGCDHKAFLDAHHIQHWSRGGPTNLDNLCLLCRRHHRAVHELGFEVARLPDDSLRFSSPHGLKLPKTYHLPEVSEAFLEDLAIRHREEGRKIDEWSITPKNYGGERIDYVEVIDALANESTFSL